MKVAISEEEGIRQQAKGRREAGGNRHEEDEDQRE
jgi:hypothetical protein